MGDVEILVVKDYVIDSFFDGLFDLFVTTRRIEVILFLLTYVVLCLYSIFVFSLLILLVSFELFDSQS